MSSGKSQEKAFIKRDWGAEVAQNREQGEKKAPWMFVEKKKRLNTSRRKTEGRAQPCFIEGSFRQKVSISEREGWRPVDRGEYSFLAKGGKKRHPGSGAAPGQLTGAGQSFSRGGSTEGSHCSRAGSTRR